jgi:Putative quorum-sensing-regulated virulence factor
MNFTMPWGKYKGVPLQEVPSDYLLWCLDNAQNMGRNLRDAIRTHLGLPPEPGVDGDARNPPRAKPPPAPPRPAPPRPPPRTVPLQIQGIDPEKLDKIVATWWKRVARQHHPDVGGQHEVFVALNNAHEELKKFLNDLKTKK